MSRSRSYALCGGIVALAAIYATTRGDGVFAVSMFLIAVIFATWARREWKRVADGV